MWDLSSQIRAGLIQKNGAKGMDAQKKRPARMGQVARERVDIGYPAHESDKPFFKS